MKDLQIHDPALHRSQYHIRCLSLSAQLLIHKLELRCLLLSTLDGLFQHFMNELHTHCLPRALQLIRFPMPLLSIHLSKCRKKLPCSSQHQYRDRITHHLQLPPQFQNILLLLQPPHLLRCIFSPISRAACRQTRPIPLIDLQPERKLRLPELLHCILSYSAHLGQRGAVFIILP
jgi:hypothetical protein